MATSLFGPSPLDYQQAQQAALQQQASSYAQLNPLQRAAQGMYQAGSNLGGGIAGLMGIQDPMVEKASKIESILQGSDQTSAQGFMDLYKKFSDANMPQQAQMAAAKAKEFKQSEATLAQTQAKTAQEAAAARAAQYKIDQEKAMTAELAALPPEHTNADILKIATKYGSLKDVLQITQQATDKQAAREQALTLAREASQARIDAAKAAGASKLEIAQLQADSRMQAAQLVAALKGSAKENKPLSAGLQKDEINDLATIDTYAAQQAALAPSIQNLTPDAKGVRKLELGPLKNVEYAARNAAGKSTPESRAYEALKSAVDTAVNLQVSAEKGVQTDKDVLRFAQALIASYGRNDTKATLEALTRYQEAIAKAATKVQTRIESRRKSQNVEPYGFSSKPAAGTAENPIKLD